MSHVFFHLFFAILLSLWVVSCNQSEAPDYDYTRSEQIMAVCQAVLDGDSAEISRLAGDASPDVAHRQKAILFDLLRKRDVQRNELLEAQRLLEQGDYKAMMDYIATLEGRGQASPELLHLREFSPAMQCLEVFCARMPWQDSESLKLALGLLYPYVSLLNESDTFREFLAEQQKELVRLQAVEKQEAARKLTEQATWYAVAGRTKECRAHLEKLAELMPDNGVTSLLRISNMAPTDALRNRLVSDEPLPADEARCFSLAVLAAWPALTDAEQSAAGKKLLPFSDDTAGIAGTILKARFLNSGALYRKALADWCRFSPLAEECVPTDAIAYLNGCIADGQKTTETTECKVIPVFPDFIRFLNLLD